MRILQSAFRLGLYCAVVSSATVVLAQFPGGGGGWGGGWGGGMGGMGGGWGGGGMGGGGWGGRRGGGGGGWDPSAMWDRMDANSNGMLDPEEMQGRARGFLERFAGDAGLDLSQPIPLADVKRIMQERFQRGGRGGGGGGGGDSGGGGGGAQPAESTGAPASSGSSATVKSELLVPGFGVTENLPPVPGFGDAAPAGGKGRGKVQAITVAAVGTSSSGASGGGAKSGGFSYANAPLDAKIVRYAEGMLKQYDANKDGVLQKEEWSKMRGDPKGADKNGDEILTKDEVAEQLANYGKKQGGDDKGKSPSEEPKHGGPQGPAVAAAPPSAPSSTSTSNNASPRFAVRFLTPTERLPKGLPSWFAGKDSNGDGQVLMAEYASTWSDSKVAEFDKYDLNGDGIITAKECLRAEKK